MGKRSKPLLPSASAPDAKRTLSPSEARDYMMARVAAALVAAKAVEESCLEFLASAVNPDTDRKGKERITALGDALEAAGTVCLALEDAEDCRRSLDDVGFALSEPWEES